MQLRFTPAFLFVDIFFLFIPGMLIDYIRSGVWSPTDWREYGISQQSSYAALHNSGFPFPQGGGDLSTVQGFRYRRVGGLADFFNVYPEIASLIKRFVIHDPKRNEPNLTPKSQIYIWEKEINNKFNGLSCSFNPDICINLLHKINTVMS
jgi:hypothetical protein